MNLPKEIIIYPGHNDYSSINDELKTNSYIK